MKLTNADRDAFVAAVMDDVPFTDYTEQFRAWLDNAVTPLLPAKVKAVWADKSLRHLIARNAVIGSFGGASFYAPDILDAKDKAPLHEECTRLRALYDNQWSVRRELRGRLRSIIASCSTLKQATEMLPEFTKYLPQERDGKIDRSMPVIANVVSDLTKAGWPKGKGKK